MAARTQGKHHELVMRAALEYGELGFRVIPISPGTKRPTHAAWQRCASKEPRVIKPLFSDFPEANIGLLMGNGFFALDIDPRNGGDKSFERLVRGEELPQTAWSKTGGGGDHYLFREPAGFRVRSTQNCWPGIDIKGRGGLIVVEPSIHPSGGRYEWKIHPRHAVSDPPSWLIGEFHDRNLWLPASEADDARDGTPVGRVECSLTGDTDALLARMIKTYPVENEGQRNERMIQVLGCLLGRRFHRRFVRDVTEAWWRYFYNQGLIRTSPSEAPRLIDQSIDSMLRSPEFVIVSSNVDHRAAVGQIRLNSDQHRLLGENLDNLGERDGRSGHKSRATPR